MSQFSEDRDVLLRYYSEIQSSQSARLIGFSVALFTLLQMVQLSGQGTFSKIFPFVSMSVPSWLITILNFVVFLIFLGTVFLLNLYIIRSIFRYAVYGLLISQLMYVSQTVAKPQKDESFLRVISKIAVERIEKRKLYTFIPLIWFISAKRFERDNKKGWLFSGFLAIVLALSFLWFLR